MNLIFLSISVILTRAVSFAVNVAISQNESREKFSTDDILPKHDSAPRSSQFQEERLEEIASLFQMAGIDTENTDALDDHGKDVLKRIESLVGPASAKMISIVAKLAADMKKQVLGSGEVEKEKTPTTLLEEILSTLEAQGGKFDYSKISEALDNWMATLMPNVPQPSEG